MVFFCFRIWGILVVMIFLVGDGVIGGFFILSIDWVGFIGSLDLVGIVIWGVYIWFFFGVFL